MMNVSNLFLENAGDPRIGFVIATVLGYCLYKIMKTRNLPGPTDASTQAVASIVYTDDSDNYKLVLVIRTDLKMGKGKVAAQCAHAAVAAYKSARKHTAVLSAWEDCGQAKIAVKVDNATALCEVARHAKALGLLANVIQDAGHTQIPAGSKTVCAVGPGPAPLIDQVTGHLKLY